MTMYTRVKYSLYEGASEKWELNIDLRLPDNFLLFSEDLKSKALKNNLLEEIRKEVEFEHRQVHPSYSRPATAERIVIHEVVVTNNWTSNRE